MFADRKEFRRWLYRFLPVTHLAFYPARRRGLDYWATRGGLRPVAVAQKAFLLEWVAIREGIFLEWDAGDGIIGSHTFWLEEAGWKGFSMEERAEAGERLRQNRPLSFLPVAESDRLSHEGVDLVTARRDGSIRRVKETISAGLRPRWVILQARDPQPEIFSAMNWAGYRLDHFIHDDEYYRWKGIRSKKILL